MKKVYVVSKTSGSYSDTVTYVVKCYLSKTKAEEFVNSQNTTISSYTKITSNLSNIINNVKNSPLLTELNLSMGEFVEKELNYISNDVEMNKLVMSNFNQNFSSFEDIDCSFDCEEVELDDE